MKRETRRYTTRSHRRPSPSGSGPIRRRQILDLPALLQNLADSQRTGSLVLRGPSRRTIILYLRDGNVAAATDGDEMRLGKALVVTGAFDWDALREFREFFQPTASTLERLILDQGKADEAAIREARLFSIRELVCEALSWDRPETDFFDGPPVPEVVRMGLPPDGPGSPTKPLLMTGVYQLDEWSRIRESVASDRDVPTPVDGADPSEELLEIFKWVDGARSVLEIVARARLGRFEGCGLLRDLAEAEAIRFLGAGRLKELGDQLDVKPGGDPDSRDKRITVYSRAEELGLNERAVSVWLAEAHEARGDAEEASARYLRLGRGEKSTAEGLGYLRRALILRPDDDGLKRELIQRLIDADRHEDAALQTELYVAWLRKKGDPIATLRATREILEQLDEFDEMLVLRAELSEDAGNRPEAVHLYRRIAAIRLDSDLAEEFTFEEGTEILGRILELVPEDLDSRHRLASLLVVKRPQDAILELKEFVRHASRLSEADPRLADVYETLSSLDPALPLTGPKVNAYLDAGNKDAAERELRASLETTTPDLDLLQAFERLHKGTDSQSTHELLAKALLESGQVRRGVAELGRLAVRATDSGDDGGALAAYEMALDFDPFDWETRSALAELLLVSDNPSAWLTNLRALCDIARIRGDTEIASAMLGVYVREAPDDLCSRLEWIETLIASESADALTALSEFESTCEDQQNLGLRNWAREQAKRLGGE